MPINPVPVSNRETKLEERSLKKVDSRKIEFVLSKPIYSFSDMVLEENTREEIENAMALFQHKEKVFEEWHLKRVIKTPYNLCVNFYGEPGTGKTMAADAVAQQLQLPILRVNYAEIESKYVGETSKNLVELFSQAQSHNALILFDEADAMLSRRVTDMSNATDVSVNQTRSVLLGQLDVFTGMVIFTTNFIKNYDPAFMRRIPYHIRFSLPNEEVRLRLLKHYLDDTVPNHVDFSAVAAKYEGISGSDIANATLTAALKAARAGAEELSQEELEAALERSLVSKRENSGEFFIRKDQIAERETIHITQLSGLGG